MKVKIRDIPSEGLELIQSVSPSSLGLSEEDIHVSSPLTVKAHLERFEDTVTVRTEVRGRYSFICARCLDTVEDTRLDVFDFDYPLEEGMESLDLGEDIRQEMILKQPMKVLCREDCQGICLRCGANLNKEECRCLKIKNGHQVTGPRFEDQKDFWRVTL